MGVGSGIQKGIRMNQIPTLRDYQHQAIAEVKASLAKLAAEIKEDPTSKKKKAVILTVATGGGKTTIAAQLISNSTDLGKNVLFLAHRKELVIQAKNRMHQFGLRPGIIMSGWAQRKNEVMVASVPTLVRRLHKLSVRIDLIVVDECHHSVSASFRKILEAYPQAWIVGLTATPYRMDGKGLGDLYSDIVAPITIADLIRRGYLVPARTFAPKSVNLQGVKVTAGDYDKGEMYDRYNKREVYAQVVENYQRFAPGTRGIIFCVNVEHSKNTVNSFLQAGISAAHVDGEDNAHHRAKVLADFAAGKYQVLSNVNLFTEGFDMPQIQTVILNRATKSKSLYFQMVGRGLRPVYAQWHSLLKNASDQDNLDAIEESGKTHCIVIDQGANILEHGPVDAEEAPTLQPSKKKRGGGVAPVKECPSCFLMLPTPARVCTGCGHPFQIEKEAKVEEFEEVRIGGLVVANAKKQKPMPPHLEGKQLWQLNENELREVQKFRGYKPGWVRFQMELRQERRQVA